MSPLLSICWVVSFFSTVHFTTKVTTDDEPTSCRAKSASTNTLDTGLHQLVSMKFPSFCTQNGIRGHLGFSLPVAHTFDLVGWLVVLRINVDLAIFQSYLDLEVGDNQSLKVQVARPGIEPRSSCSASQELNHSATAAPSHTFEP